VFVSSRRRLTLFAALALTKGIYHNSGDTVKENGETAPSGTSRQRPRSPGISRRFTPSGIGSCRRHGNSGRIAASGLRERNWEDQQKKVRG
jgi:hypothetical protein